MASCNAKRPVAVPARVTSSAPAISRSRISPRASRTATPTAGASSARRSRPPIGKVRFGPGTRASSAKCMSAPSRPEGTFEGLRERLEHFRDAGYTCLEIMPINEFPGARNWGYDGTLIFAPASAYGTPEELRALVDRAHELGLCMVLDVVYNHFGEVDNFVEHYAPEWFNDEVKTPWGPGIDFNQPMVRQFYYENAVMWLTEYDFDGLRFDSVHEIKTDARDQFLGELAQAAKTAQAARQADRRERRELGCAGWSAMTATSR